MKKRHRRKRRTLRRRKRRTMRKRGGKACPPPDKPSYKKVDDCVQIRKTASGRTYKVSYPDDEACCPDEYYVCRIEGNGDKREPVCLTEKEAEAEEALAAEADYTEQAEQIISPELATMLKDIPLLDERKLLTGTPLVDFDV